MPTKTYDRLPPEKRARIEGAALDEFAACRFDSASINRIVKAAGIPRGSFYQYFSGKEDIYLLVMEKIAKEKLAIVSQVGQEKEGGFFETLLRSIPPVFQWAEKDPRYREIGMMIAKDDSAFVKTLVGKMDHSQEYLRRALISDQEKGYIRKGIDLDIVMNLYLSQIMEILKLYDGTDSEEKVRTSVRALTDIIEHGIGTGKREEDGGS